MIVAVLLNVGLDEYIYYFDDIERLISCIDWTSLYSMDSCILQLQSKKIFEVDRFCINEDPRFGKYSTDIRNEHFYSSYEMDFLTDSKKYFNEFLDFQKDYLKKNLIIPCIFQEEFDFLVNNYECLTICLTTYNPKPSNCSFDLCTETSFTKFLLDNLYNQ